MEYPQCTRQSSWLLVVRHWNPHGAWGVLTPASRANYQPGSFNMAPKLFSLCQFTSLLPRLTSPVCLELTILVQTGNAMYSDNNVTSPKIHIGFEYLFIHLLLDIDCSACVSALQSKQLMERLQTVPSIKTSVCELSTMFLGFYLLSSHVLVSQPHWYLDFELIPLRRLYISDIYL